MSVLTFVAEIVKALAWPVATVAIALVFRTQVRGLLGRIRKGKVGPAEFEFEKEVEALKEEAPQVSDSTLFSRAPSEALVQNPRAAILDAWLGVEASIRSLMKRNNIAPPSVARGPLEMVRTLRKSGLLSADQVALFNDLRVLRNQAAHVVDFNPSTDSVLSYIHLADGLKESIDRRAG